ncbi:MAG TPA: cytochrome c biogenesis protein CcdA, partial [Planctomycetota bacterium]|nr:cytochrome c biogenesis protein CcdA [Planctomycetota bacterium]
IPADAAYRVEALRATLAGLTCSDADGVCIDYAESVAWAGRGDDALFAAFDAPEPDAGGSDLEDLGLGAFLLLAIFWGLFTLLMPCTYPMIPITISFFTKQAEARQAGTWTLSLAYGAGIVGIFVAIGVVVGPVIIAFATHPVTNLVIGALFLFFAFVLFGALTLQPPRFLMDVAGSASRRGGYAGVFLMGATLVVTSFTCTAPFVGGLLTVGASGEGASLGRIALGMAVFGATVALPFVGLSMVPARVKQMPKSGEWMNTLKVTLGFVELAAALKFFSNTDLVWGWGALSRELFLVLWAGIFLAAALYLFGFVRLKGASGEVGPVRMTSAVGFLLFALYCGYGAQGWQLDPILTAIAPNYSHATVRGAASAGGPSAAGGAVA